MASGLYGRKAEEHMLRAAYHRRSCPDATKVNAELVLVTGKSGTGKSTLARSLMDSVVSDGGFFCLGKFDQMQRPEPYAAFVSAFTELSEQIKTRNDADALVKIIRQRVDDADDVDTKLLIDTVPALESVLRSTDSDSFSNSGVRGTDHVQQRRFLAACRGLVRAVASPEHPLVLFLDDLQWADIGSLDLLATLAGDKGNEGFMLIGTCRGNEVSVEDYLSVVLRALENKGVTITDIHLKNFTRDDVRGFVPTLFPTTTDYDKIADLLFDQTDGNMFFILQLAKRLQEDGILTADGQPSQFDHVRISTIVTSGDVIGMMKKVLDRLPGNVKAVLETASCLGASFQERHLSIVLPEVKVREALMVAAEKGLVYYQAGSGSGSFAHDRMQEATYSLIPKEKRPSVHASIGRKLLNGLSEKETDSAIFVIVNQVGAGITEIRGSDDCNAFAATCLRAGKKAMASSAFRTAAAYLNLGIELLKPRGWRDEYYLSLALANAAAEVEYCLGNFDKTDSLLNDIFNHARSFDDKIQAYNTHVFALGAQERYPEAIRTAFRVLRELGEPFPRKPSTIQSAIELLRTKWLLRGKTSDDLLNLPPMTDTKKLAALQMMNLVYLYVFFSEQDFVPLLTTRIVRRTLQYGLSGMGCAGFSTYGMLLCGLGEVDKGYKYCQVALRMMDQIDSSRVWLARVYVSVHGMVLHWKEPVRHSLVPLKKAHRVGCETGDIEFAMMGAALYLFSASFAGLPIPELVGEMISFVDEMRMYKQEGVLSLVLPYVQLHMNYMGKAKDPFVLTGEFLDEESYLATQEAANNTANISMIHLFHADIFYHMNMLDRAAEEAKKSRNISKTAHSSLGVVSQVFIDGMISAELARRSRERQHFKMARQSRKQLRKWAKGSPHNFLPACRLVEAEVEAIEGDVDAALDKYKSAIDLAGEEGFLQVQALACERMGVTLHYFRKEKDVNEYMKKARDLYEAWGCRIKVDQLDEILSGNEQPPFPRT